MTKRQKGKKTKRQKKDKETKSKKDKKKTERQKDKKTKRQIKKTKKIKCRTHISTLLYVVLYFSTIWVHTHICIYESSNTVNRRSKAKHDGWG